MIKRIDTRKIMVGDVQIGGKDQVIIQSMTKQEKSHIIQLLLF